VKNQQQVGHNHEVERHLLDISNFFNKSKTEKLAVQNYSKIVLFSACCMACKGPQHTSNVHCFIVENNTT
jgi:hypothetical protein